MRERGQERGHREAEAGGGAGKHAYSQGWRRAGLTWRVAHAAEGRETRGQAAAGRCWPFPFPSVLSNQTPQLHSCRRAAASQAKERLLSKAPPHVPRTLKTCGWWWGERIELSWGSATCDRTAGPQQTALCPRATQACDGPPLCISASRLPIAFHSHPALLSGTPSSAL